jgi:8-oxo-dGTP pyrophosphatase MutT (NUDIX family)
LLTELTFLSLNVHNVRLSIDESFNKGYPLQSSLENSDQFMTTADLTWSQRPTWVHRILSVFSQPPRRQVAALCYRKRQGKLEVMLVTSRGRGRWILPKGWHELEKAAHETAAIEAYEEAGIIGSANRKPFARFRSEKLMDTGLSVPTSVDVFLLKVDKQQAKFPEAGQRKLEWLPVRKAIKRADDPGVRKVLQLFEDKMANKSRD